MGRDQSQQGPIMVAMLEQHRAELEGLCREYGVARLEVFGSAATGDFDPACSDVDFLVEFLPDHDLGPWLSYVFAFQEALQALFGCAVDLVTPGSLRNPHFIREVERTRRLLYAA